MMARTAWLNSTSRTDGQHRSQIWSGALNGPPSHFAVHLDTVSSADAALLTTAEAVFNWTALAWAKHKMRWQHDRYFLRHPAYRGRPLLEFLSPIRLGRGRL